MGEVLQQWALLNTNPIRTSGRVRSDSVTLTKENTEEMIAAKEKQAKETEAKKQHHTWIKIWRIERDAKYAEGVIARKQGRNRLRQIKELSK